MKKDLILSDKIVYNLCGVMLENIFTMENKRIFKRVLWL